MVFPARTPAAVLAGSLATVAGVATAFAVFYGYRSEEAAWIFVNVAMVLAVWWQRDIELRGTALDGPSGPSTPRRQVVGAALALLGAAICLGGTVGLLRDWQKGFDRAWASWLTGTAVLGIGLDLLWARWKGSSESRWRLVGLVAGVVAVGGVFRLGTFYFFPAPYQITQIEELQVGALGREMLDGGRNRWEYLSQAWLGGLGLALGGPTLLSTRLPSTILSFLKIVPLFLMLRFSAGTLGAIVGSLLLAVSPWDVTFARVSTNHNVLVVLTAFALLAGPARRGRPSAYVWLGLLAGYVVYEYVLYRPLAVVAVAGAFLVSLRDRHAAWPARLLRPLLTLALLAAVTVPLYLFLTHNDRTREFYDGIGRARANTSYYNPDDSWPVMLQKRATRARQAAALLFFRGAESPMTNPQSRPLVDPVTSLLLVVGTAYAIAHPLRQVFGLTTAAGVATYGAALVLTGNFDFVRAGSALGYVYLVAGFGAAGLAEGLRRGGGAGRRRLVTAALGAGILYAVWFSVDHLHYFVTDTAIRRSQFRDLAYLSSWIGQNTRSGERIIIAAPNFAYLMERHDAAWMRGPEAEGAAYWDVHSALSDWAKQAPQPTLLMIYGGIAAKDVQAYLRWLLPSLSFSLAPGPVGADKDLLYVHADALPEGLEQRLLRWGCQPVAIEVDLLDAQGRVLTTANSAAGLIDPTLWPGSIQTALMRMPPLAKSARARIVADFRVEKGGDYIFPMDIYPGTVVLRIDSVEIPYPPTVAVRLEPGMHHIDVRSEYNPNASAPTVRVYWQGPDTGDQRQVVPFYRLAPERCAD